MIGLQINNYFFFQAQPERPVWGYLQHLCASIFSYFHILRPQNIRKKNAT
jgi:hypothetical protein